MRSAATLSCPRANSFPPWLVLESCAAAGGDPWRAPPAALGTEFGHVASLIHDDIIDEDEVRRGRSSVQHRYGRDDAIVAKADPLPAQVVITDTTLRDGQQTPGVALDEDTKVDIAQTQPVNKPVVGSHLFSHESGLPVDGILREPACYEPHPPERIGATRRIVLGKHTGRNCVRAVLDQAGRVPRDPDVDMLLDIVKRRGSAGESVSPGELARLTESLQFSQKGPGG